MEAFGALSSLIKYLSLYYEYVGYSIAGSSYRAEAPLTKEEKEMLRLFGLRESRPAKTASSQAQPDIIITKDKQFVSARGTIYAQDMEEFSLNTLRAVAEKLRGRRGFNLEGITIAGNLILGMETAFFLKTLKELGAEVHLYCAENEIIEPTLVDFTAETGIQLWRALSRYGDCGPESEHSTAFDMIQEAKPAIIIDDGALLLRIMHKELPELLPGLIGATEQTSGGVNAIRQMEKRGQNTARVMLANNARVKSKFDNFYGTSESCVLTILSLLDQMGDGFPDYIVMTGFGPVGKGCARLFSGLGFEASIVEINAMKSMEAKFLGYNFYTSIADAVAARSGNEKVMLVTGTGFENTVTSSIIGALPSGSIVVTVGGTANEINTTEIINSGYKSEEIAPHIQRLTNSAGHSVVLLAEGNGVNYTVMHGNAIETIELTFCAHLMAVFHLMTDQAGRGKSGLFDLPPEYSEFIAETHLKTIGAWDEGFSPVATLKL